MTPIEDDIAKSFVDFNRYHDQRATNRLRSTLPVFGACVLVGTGMALALLVERSRVPALVSV